MNFLPDVILLGQLPLATVALTGLAGALLAHWLTAWLGRRSGAEEIVLNLLVGGVVGAKLIYVVLDPRSYLANLGTLILFPYGPLALPAGAAGGLLAVGLGLWRRPDRLVLLDHAAAPLALGLAVALVGWKAPGSWAFAPLAAVAAVAALATAGPGESPTPGHRAARTAVLLAGALVLADQARPGGSISFFQVTAASAGTSAWLWLQRTTKKDSGT